MVNKTRFKDKLNRLCLMKAAICIYKRCLFNIKIFYIQCYHMMCPKMTKLKKQQLEIVFVKRCVLNHMLVRLDNAHIFETPSSYTS